MNDLIERLLELPLRKRVMLLVGGVSFMFFLYGYIVFWPRNTQLANLEAQKENLIHDRDRKTVLVANLEKARQEVVQLDGDLHKAAAELPTTKEIPDLLSNISSLARESGLEILQFKLRAEQYEDFYAKVPVDVLVRGTYHQVGAFFGKVGGMARIVNVTDVGIKGPVRLETDPVTLDTSCVAVTFRFLDEAERERIRKQKEKEKGGKP